MPKTLAIPDAAVIHRPVPERVLDVEELRFSCDQTEVLHGLTFQLSRGEVLGLLGAKGAGKRTALKILAGILSPGSGRIDIQSFALPQDRDQVKRILGC